MSFEKIGEPAKAIFDNMETYHHSALLNDHLWIFSRKYKEQPLHNWGHRVSFCGGYSAYFDIGSKSWSSKVEYPSLSDEENLEEVLFMLNSNIFLLLYTQFGGINFERLLRWDIDERNWTTVEHFKVDESNNLLANDATTRSQLIVVKQHSYINNSIFFISVVDEIIRIHKLSMDHHHTSLTLLHDVSVGDRFRMRTPIMAARCCDEVYVIGGIHGCGFRFDPKTWISFNLVTKSTDVIEVMDDAPPFSFSGSRYTKVLTNDLWVHATGSIARGMTGSAFSGEIWIVDLKSKPLKWKKSDVRVPEMDGEQLIIELSDSGYIYVLDNNEGVLSAKIQ